MQEKRGSTQRTRELISAMEKRAWGDRSGEWFTRNMLTDVGKKYEGEPVIIRRALAIQNILEAMTDPELFYKDPNPYWVIRDNELIVGVITLGSLGLGKVFPNYLTEDETRVSTITAKTEMALFGHNSVNYEVLLKKGINGIKADCDDYLNGVEKTNQYYDDVFNFCENLEKNRGRLQEAFAAGLGAASAGAAGIGDSIKAVSEIDDQVKGRRLKTGDREIGVLFERINANLKKGVVEGEINLPIILKIKDKVTDKKNILHNKRDFYKSVKVACGAVVEYARNFADLAEEMAASEPNPERKKELIEIGRVCRKVPAEPSETFHEALQSIYFFHLALHSSMNQLSLGRLDQVLQPYINKTKENEQLELFECFLIKCAERLILDPNTFVRQDHVDYGSNLLTVPVALDQWAEANEFLQNIIIGGKTRDGKDAVNDCSYLILKAYRHTRLYTPTLNARIHNGHFNGNGKPSRFIEAVSRCLYETGNAMPIVGNDETLIPAMAKYSGIPEEEAMDYVIDGCWEPLLNGTCDWTFRMFNMLTVLECALNGGATLSSNPILLRGEKMTYETPLPSKDTDFEELKEILKAHIRFYTDQAALSIYKLYLIDQAVNPTPLYSALLKDCMEKGRDKTWGGAKFRLAGIIAAAVPNVVNSLAAIKKWVYDEKAFEITDVIEAFRYSYNASGNKEKQKKFDKIKVYFQSDSPRFGNDEPEADRIMAWLLDTYYNCIQESRKLAEEVFLKPAPPGDEKRIASLRALAGYSGESMVEEFGEDFEIKFTAGMGTFELFNIFGMGNAASADRDNAGDPIARNFSPMVGTTKYSIGHLLTSFKEIGLNRFAGGAITDLCLEETDLKKDGVEKIAAIIGEFVNNGGNLMSVTISDRDELEHIYQLCEAYRAGDKEAQAQLKKYEHVSVRVGGFQVPFITLPKQHQLSYIGRPMSPSLNS